MKLSRRWPKFTNDHLSFLKNILEQPITIGYAGLILMVTATSLWAIAVPLTEATIAPGTVSVSAQRRTVSHVYGGKVDRLLVSEGDAVEPGQTLLKLDTEELNSELEVLRYQHFAREAAVDRLTAERVGTNEWEFQPTLLHQAAANPALMQFLEGEKRNFEARRQSYIAKKAMLEEPSKESTEQRARLLKQIGSIDRQLTIVREEAVNAAKLFEKGYGTRSRAVALERDVEQLITNRIELETALAELRNTIDDAARQQILHEAEFKNDVESEVLSAEREIADIEGQIRALEKKVNNQVVQANVHGIVVDLRNLSVNDVIRPATPIIDILPTDSKLIVEAHLAPTEIDGVAEGLDVDVRFPAFATGGLSDIRGRLTFVSADVVQDAQTPQAYYRIQVAIEDWPIADNGIEIIPGMPAEILIKKHERTLLEYILAPLTDHVVKAFAV